MSPCPRKSNQQSPPNLVRYCSSLGYQEPYKSFSQHSLAIPYHFRLLLQTSDLDGMYTRYNVNTFCDPSNNNNDGEGVLRHGQKARVASRDSSYIGGRQAMISITFDLIFITYKIISPPAKGDDSTG